MNDINILNIFIESICFSMIFTTNLIILLDIYFEICKFSYFHTIYLHLNNYYILNIIIFIFFIILYLVYEYNYLIM